ncbi:MAG: universal stress protein [Cyanobacteria bacterium NC_groundwater_1444_Ag_S-0.65um_54_12]|nr:universal stress protein [Cyanobacteria bacterium NC_groundwater_1444_Ag_S-0.65um_54_12]
MKIMVATDGSEYSRAALAALDKLLPLQEAEVILLTVVPWPVGGDISSLLGPPYVDYSQLEQQIQSEGEHRLAAGKAILQSGGILPQTVLLKGDPATEILEYAQQQRPDLIVVGSHGRKGFQRLLLGSVSGKVVNDASCPVLIVKLPSLGSHLTNI